METRECRNAKRLFSDCFDGDLAPERLTRIREHLEECPPCRAAYTSYESTFRAVRELPSVAVSDSFETRLRARIRREGGEAQRSSWWTDLARIPLPIPLGVAAILFVSVFTYKKMSADQPVSPGQMTSTSAVADTTPIVENTRPDYFPLLQSHEAALGSMVDYQYGPPRPHSFFPPRDSHGSPVEEPHSAAHRHGPGGSRSAASPSPPPAGPVDTFQTQ